MLEGGALGQQLRNILDAEAAGTARQEERIAALEQRGYRIVDGGQVGAYDGPGCGRRSAPGPAGGPRDTPPTSSSSK